MARRQFAVSAASGIHDGMYLPLHVGRHGQQYSAAANQFLHGMTMRDCDCFGQLLGKRQHGDRAYEASNYYHVPRWPSKFGPVGRQS